MFYELLFYAREYNEQTLYFIFLGSGVIVACFVTTFGTVSFDAGALNEMCTNFRATN